MSRAGYLLAGGKSSRMGRDKALLPFHGATLGAHVAAVVAAAAGSMTVVGDPEKYASLGYPVLPDRSPGAGPLGGIETALYHTRADWNLVVACDMPKLTAEFLRELLDAGEHRQAGVLLPAGPTGRPEPLVAVYHRCCGPALRRALDAGVRRVTEALASLDVVVWEMHNAACLENLNTPEEWARYAAH